jgi:hypothetical protein
MTTVDLEFIRYDTSGAFSPADSAPPAITDIVFDAANNQIVLTWESINGRTYVLEGSPDLRDWQELEDSIPATGQSTTLSVDRPEEAGFFYYRIGLE